MVHRHRLGDLENMDSPSSHRNGHGRRDSIGSAGNLPQISSRSADKTWSCSFSGSRVKTCLRVRGRGRLSEIDPVSTDHSTALRLATVLVLRNTTAAFIGGIGNPGESIVEACGRGLRKRKDETR